MEDLLKKILVPIKELQTIRGIDLPIGLEFLQLVVTGPPGAGKSYYINQIRGWPNEGYIDLTRKGWWRDQSLTYRPREVHLGLPFIGHREALTVFDKEWLESPTVPVIDFQRVRIPPSGDYFFQTNWFNRYIFEFLLPDPDIIYERRMARQDQGYFPVDTALTREMVINQTLAYQEIALYLHRAGMNIYIRKGLNKPPMRIAEKGSTTVPRWAITQRPARPSLRSLAGWKRLILRRDPSQWFTITHNPQAIKGSNRIAHDGKSFEMLLGRQQLHFQPELPLGVKRKNMLKNWIITTPQACSERTLTGFIRIQEGETIIIGRASKEIHDILHFSKDVAKRHVTVTNQKGDLTITPLDTDKDVRLVRLDDLDHRERVEANRFKSFKRICQIYGGPIQLLEPDTALDLLRRVNALLLTEPFRPLNEQGQAGGLIHLEQDSSAVVVGDLHAQVDNFLKILSENCLLQYLGNKSASLILLGDAVHSENADEMEEMDSSILMMDLILSMKLQFPEHFFYLRGNHDSFDPDISKNGISQGVLMRQRLEKLRGAEYVAEMETFYDRLPYVVVGKTFYCCHAAPPRARVTLEDIVNIANLPDLAGEITKNRIQRPNYLGGYNKSDVKAFRKALNLPKGTPFIVGHTPLDPFGSIWKNVGAIKNHHIVYSAHQRGPSLFQQSDKQMIALSYPAEPITKLINDLK